MHSEQPADAHFMARLLAKLAHHRFLDCLRELDSSTGHPPEWSTSFQSASRTPLSLVDNNRIRG